MGRRQNKTNPPRPHRLRRWLFFLAALLLIPTAVLAAYVLSRDAWHMLDEEKLGYDALSVQVFDGEDRLFSALSGGEERLLTKVVDLPDHVKNAFIAAEDARFYDHPGVDVISLLPDIPLPVLILIVEAVFFLLDILFEAAANLYLKRVRRFLLR